MTEGDTLWYHGVFAARFVQEGRLDIFPDLGNAAQALLPGEQPDVPRDRVLPVRPRPAVAAVQPRVRPARAPRGVLRRATSRPGCALRDRGCRRARIPRNRRRPSRSGDQRRDVRDVPAGRDGVAARRAGSNRYRSRSPGSRRRCRSARSSRSRCPLTVLTVLVVVDAVRRRRPRCVAAWLLPLGVFGSFWFIRNWALVDNPLPFYDLRLGPLHLPGPHASSRRLVDRGPPLRAGHVVARGSAPVSGRPTGGRGC